MENLTFDITHREIGYISSLWTEKKGMLSPLDTFAVSGEISEKEKGKLRQQNLLSGSGVISDAAEGLFTVLNNPTAVTSFLYGGASPIIDVSFYFADSGSVSLFNRGETLFVSCPGEMQRTVSFLGQFIGASPFRIAKLDTTLSQTEGLTLVALIDLVRKGLLGTMLEVKEEKDQSISPDEIARWISHDTSHLQWLSVLLKKYLGVSDAVQIKDITAAIDALAKEKLVTKKGNDAVVGEAIEECASRLITLETFLMVRSVRLREKGDPVINQFEVIKSGGNGLLLWEVLNGDRVHFLSLSPLMLMSILDALCDPQTLKEIGEKNVTALKKPLTCAKCGTELASDAEFCSKCGQPTKKKKKPEELTCLGCGRKLPADAKFCDGCGKAVE